MVTGLRGASSAGVVSGGTSGPRVPSFPWDRPSSALFMATEDTREGKQSRKEIVPFATTCVGLEIIVLNEANQTKDKHRKMPLLCAA